MEQDTALHRFVFYGHPSPLIRNEIPSDSRIPGSSDQSSPRPLPLRSFFRASVPLPIGESCLKRMGTPATQARSGGVSTWMGDHLGIPGVPGSFLLVRARGVQYWWFSLCLFCWSSFSTNLRYAGGATGWFTFLALSLNSRTRLVLQQRKSSRLECTQLKQTSKQANNITFDLTHLSL